MSIEQKESYVKSHCANRSRICLMCSRQGNCTAFHLNLELRTWERKNGK
jgi:hypothetical protein